MQLLVILAFDELFYDVLKTNEHPFDEKKMGTIVRKFRRFTLTVFLPTIFSLRLHFYYRVDLTNFFFPRCDNHTMPCIYAYILSEMISRKKNGFTEWMNYFSGPTIRTSNKIPLLVKQASALRLEIRCSKILIRASTLPSLLITVRLWLLPLATYLLNLANN